MPLDLSSSNHLHVFTGNYGDIVNVELAMDRTV